MIIAVPRELAEGEKRVALVPETVKKLGERRLQVVVEAGAGSASSYGDEAYLAAGARIEPEVEKLYASADAVLKVQEPAEGGPAGKHEADLLREGSILISFLYPLSHHDLVRRLAARRITSFAMELMPRISRAQSMDALSSMSSIAGYKAVLVAASALPRYFPMLMTAAGTITPARVLVLGAGVAGLQAIATAKRLGAVVEAYDVRPVVKEQVESLGARFIELDVRVIDAQDAGGYAREQSADFQARMRELLHAHVKKADVVITTALVPGKKAPLLVTREMVRDMKPGSVVVDLAAEQGGNCEATQPGRDAIEGGATVLGPLNITSTVPAHASQLYSRNISAYLLHLVGKDGKIQLDLDDELTRGPLVTRDGQVVHEPTRAAIEKKI